MRVYGHSYRATMELPMKAFWFLSGCVPRLLASENKDHIEIATASTHNPASAADLYRRYADASPDPVALTGQALVELSSERDEAGLNELRAMS